MKTRRGEVLINGTVCGLIEETAAGFSFAYRPDYLARPSAVSVSLTLPCRAEPYEAPVLFPFFSGLLAEGTLREMQCRMFKLDENDDFGLLLSSAGGDVIGAVSVRPPNT